MKPAEKLISNVLINSIDKISNKSFFESKWPTVLISGLITLAVPFLGRFNDF